MIFRDLTLTSYSVISLKRNENENVFLVYKQILMHFFFFIVILHCDFQISAFILHYISKIAIIFLVRPLVFDFSVNGCLSFVCNSRLLKVHLISPQSRCFIMRMGCSNVRNRHFLHFPNPSQQTSYFSWKFWLWAAKIAVFEGSKNIFGASVEAVR